MRKLLNTFHKFFSIHSEFTGTHSGSFFEVNKTLKKCKTKWQDICVVDTKEFGKALLLDGITQLTETQEYQYHEPMAHLPLLCHPNPESVLIIGGGDGALLRQVLLHPSIEKVDFVELDEGVVEFCKEYFPELGASAFFDPRVSLHIEDGRAFANKAQAEKRSYDAVFMDMTDPAGPSLSLYTKEFFYTIESLLKNDASFFIMHSESPDLRPKTFTKIHATLNAVFPRVQPITSYVRMYGGLWSWALCSKGTDAFYMDDSTLEKRILERNLGNLKIINKDTWPSFFNLWPVHKNLLLQNTEPATDKNPDYPFN
jgi:spermidine synthase